jgi:hypothetical protein
LIIGLCWGCVPCGAVAYSLERFARLREYQINNPSPAAYTAKVSSVSGSGTWIIASRAFGSKATLLSANKIVALITGRISVLLPGIGCKGFLQKSLDKKDRYPRRLLFAPATTLCPLFAPQYSAPLSCFHKIYGAEQASVEHPGLIGFPELGSSGLTKARRLWKAVVAPAEVAVFRRGRRAP